MIDRYQVIEQLGQGGMGVVYKARDTLLDRFVALKLLPAEKVSDPERRQRFLQEAKAASALNHPGIVAVYDLKSVDGQDVIVMELVEGETLEERLARRRPTLVEALGYAIRIADALARAHAAGIVHRDLKPSNVMVAGDGMVKILDFGLAKLVEAPFPDDEAPTQAQGGPSITQERVIVGTVAYMSPEQASGQPVDARSDIFAFGVLLYEMLAGRHPFRRRSMAETLSAIRDEPPELPTRLVPALPPEAERAVLRCLHKEPSRRWQSLSDLKAVIEDLKEDSESGRRVVVEGAAGPASSRRFWLPVAALASAVAATAVAVVLLRSRAPEARPLDLRRLTYDGGLSFEPTISPDGKLVAYASDRGGGGQLDIWVRHVGQPGPARLTSHPADDFFPSFSPDGSRVVFESARDGGGIYLVNTLGGEERRIAHGGTFPRFSPDGTQVAFMETPGWSPAGLRRMLLVSVDGGTLRPFQPEFGARGAPGSIGPIWSPDGRFLLFSGGRFDGRADLDWWVAPLAGGPPVSSGASKALPKVETVQCPAAWLKHGLLFMEGSTIEGLNLYTASTRTGRAADSSICTCYRWPPGASRG